MVSYLHRIFHSWKRICICSTIALIITCCWIYSTSTDVQQTAGKYIGPLWGKVQVKNSSGKHDLSDVGVVPVENSAGKAVPELGAPPEYKYIPPYNTSLVGKAFNVTPSLLRSIGFPLPQSSMITLTSENVRQFTIVTASNNPYFTRLYPMLLTVRKFLPSYTIIAYDLGMTSQQTSLLMSACQVKVRRFNFTRFPKHVASLKKYAWKPLIIHEMLLEVEGVMWLDSSARILSSNWSAPFSQVVKTKGAFLLSWSCHSNFAVTHPSMYGYLPTDLEKQKHIEQGAANSLLLYRTQYTYDNVIKWWVLCALVEDCMAPPSGKLACKFKQDYFTHFADCHRFDQSAINILLANLFNFEKLYSKSEMTKKMLEIRRQNIPLNKLPKLDHC